MKLGDVKNIRFEGIQIKMQRRQNERNNLDYCQYKRGQIQHETYEKLDAINKLAIFGESNIFWEWLQDWEKPHLKKSNAAIEVFLLEKYSEPSSYKTEEKMTGILSFIQEETTDGILFLFLQVMMEPMVHACSHF